MKMIPRFAKACWHAYAWALGRIVGAALSSRGLAVVLLLASVVLITGPWLRTSVSRDFRGVHIPWNNGSARFLPEFVAQAPREWRWDSIAGPLLAIVAVGMVVVLVRPKWTSHVFGLLLAVSIPALATTLWNHPALYEFFESEIRGRLMLRTVFNQQNADMMTARAPDRLTSFAGTRVSPQLELQAPTHPVLLPLRFWMYGAWLVLAAVVGAVATRRDTWTGRLAYGGMWAGAGVLLAAAAIWPRWLAEYHWARADSLESANQFAAAEESLEAASRAMPDLAVTHRYWLAKGRLDYRQRESSEHASYFVAYQYFNAGEADRARLELEPYVQAERGAGVQRQLMGEILGRIATGHVAQGKLGAAELAWSEAAAVAPWKPAYWVAQAVTVLGADPHRAKEIEDRLLAELCEVGDCFIGSDFASALGDAYFETGDFERARHMYAVAMDLFHLPKYVNLHAQEGRLGM